MVAEYNDTLGALQRLASGLHSNNCKQESICAFTSENELNNSSPHYEYADDNSNSTAMVTISNTCTNTSSQNNATQGQSRVSTDSPSSITPTSDANKADVRKPTIWDDTKSVLKRFRDTISEGGSSRSDRSHFSDSSNNQDAFQHTSMGDVFIVG